MEKIVTHTPQMTHHQQSIAFIFKSPLNNLNSSTLETKLQSVLLFMTKLRCLKNPNVWQTVNTSHQRVLACGAKTVDKYCFSVSPTYRGHKNCLLTCHFLLQGEVMQRVTGNFWTVNNNYWLSQNSCALPGFQSEL